MIGFGFYQSCGNMGLLDVCLGCGGVCGEWAGACFDRKIY